MRFLPRLLVLIRGGPDAGADAIIAAAAAAAAANATREQDALEAELGDLERDWSALKQQHDRIMRGATSFSEITAAAAADRRYRALGARIKAMRRLLEEYRTIGPIFTQRAGRRAPLEETSNG